MGGQARLWIVIDAWWVTSHSQPQPICHPPLPATSLAFSITEGMSSFGLPFGSSLSSKALEAPGTRHLGLVPPTVSEEGGGRAVEMHSISCLFPGTPWSVEELRLQDYKALNLPKDVPASFSGSKINLLSLFGIE